MGDPFDYEPRREAMARSAALGIISDIKCIDLDGIIERHGYVYALGVAEELLVMVRGRAEQLAAVLEPVAVSA